MRSRPIVLLVAVVAGVAAMPATAADWRADVRAAKAYAQQRTGSVSFAVRTTGRARGYRIHRTARSASVVKAMLMVAYLNHRSVRGRALRRGDRELLTPMIRWSRNSSASRVRDFVGYGALYRLARRVGMPRFGAGGSWGATRITAADQSKLFLSIDRLVVARHRDYAMRLLRTIVPSQRWGIARARPPGWRLFFKGGWGDGRGEVDHQVALLRRGEDRLSVAILTSANPSHAYGKATLRGVALRLLRGLRADSTLPG